MTPTEKLRATMAALGISADGLGFWEWEGGFIIANPRRTLVIAGGAYLHSAVQIARLFGRERCS